MADMTGLNDLVAEIKQASKNIQLSDGEFGKRLDTLEGSINDLYKRGGRPGAEHVADASAERKEAVEFCKSRHGIAVSKIEEVEYAPSSAEVDQAIAATHGLKAYLRHGNMDKLSAEHRKSLSAFSFGTPGNFLLPPTQADRILSCLVVVQGGGQGRGPGHVSQRGPTLAHSLIAVETRP